jgi:membrane protease YdiL (CAAX protease family)
MALLLVAGYAPGKLECLALSRRVQGIYAAVGGQFIFLSGSSWMRSAVCFLTPIVFACLVAGFQADFTWRLPYKLVVFGVSCLGEELGWRGFLQGALRPMGRIRGYLLLSVLWAAWHFTSQTGGTWQGLISRLEVLLPTVVAVTFVLALLTERTGSLVLASAAHEWLDIGVDVGSYFLWVAMAAVPVWLWIALTWPKRSLILDENSKGSFTAHVERR